MHPLQELAARRAQGRIMAMAHRGQSPIGGGASATAPNPAAQEVGRVPQTTVAVPAGGPFIRYAQKAWQPGYNADSGFGKRISQPLPAVSGYLRGLLITVNASGGSGTASLAADAPWSVLQSIDLKDPSGQNIYPTLDGYSLYLINLYGGQVGQNGAQDPATLPSFVAVDSTTGDFSFKLWLPLEFNSSGYCSLPADNSAETPRLQIVLAGAAQVYDTAPGTLPDISVSVQTPYWAVPNNLSSLAPPDVGASAQWLVTSLTNSPSSGSYKRLLDPEVGQFVHTKIYVYRDSNGVRQDFFPATGLEQWIDNFQYRSEDFTDRTDDMYKQFQVNRPTGVIAYSWRDSVQTSVSTADDGERLLVTNGATKVELAGSWATNTNLPAEVQSITGMIFPGPSGWPYGSQ